MSKLPLTDQAIVRLADPLAARHPDDVALLERLVRIASVSGPDPDSKALARSAQAVADELDAARLDWVRIVDGACEPRASSANAGAPVGAPAVLLYAHHDVQPAGRSRPGRRHASGPDTIQRGGLGCGPGLDGKQGDRMVRFTLIGVPSSAGTYGVGLEKAPLQLRRAGPIDRLLDAGLDVVDDADLPLALYRRLQGPATSRWAPNARTCLPLESSAGSSNLRPVHVRAAASDWTPTPEWIGTVRDEPDWVTRAKDRAARAKAHELAAHRRAEQLHEQAAKIQERLGHADRAQAARERAEHARELHAQALREQAEADQRSTG